MSAISPVAAFERQPRQGARRNLFGRLALRQRSSDHPMAMFAIVVSCAFVSMAFVPTAGPAFASFGAPVKINEDVRTTAKLARLPFTETDIICRGQSWGSESEDCMQLIAEESGFDQARKVRKVAAAASVSTTPNVF